MRINQYVAQATGISRRQADKLIQMRKVRIGSRIAELANHVTANDEVSLEGKRLYLPVETTSLILNKPVGYVCSRNGQGSPTIYDLLPKEHHGLKPVGRLDKDSSGLLIMTDNGQLANELAHPRYSKVKQYLVTLNRPLEDSDKLALDQGIVLRDGISHLKIEKVIASQQKIRGQFKTVPDSLVSLSMTEGRNRQIRRTFSKLGYKVAALHRTRIGDVAIGNLKSGAFQRLKLF